MGKGNGDISGIIISNLNTLNRFGCIFNRACISYCTCIPHNHNTGTAGGSLPLKVATTTTTASISKTSNTLAVICPCTISTTAKTT